MVTFGTEIFAKNVFKLREIAYKNAKIYVFAKITNERMARMALEIFATASKMIILGSLVPVVD